MDEQFAGCLYKIIAVNCELFIFRRSEASFVLNIYAEIPGYKGDNVQ